VIESFQIPFGIIINKADLKSPFQAKFKDFIKKTGYSILGTIDYCEDIPISMSHAQPVIIENPESEASKALIKIFKNLKEKINKLKE
jgi:MinD superfamily P-loop ATPase